MGESYNSTFTGAQIDEAIQKVRDGVVQLSAQTLTDEQKTQARTNIGAVKSWRELTGKPVVTEPSDTLTWDGNTDGLVSDNTGGWYKISEVVPAISDLANGAIVNKTALGADAFVDTGAGVVLHGDGAWIVFVSSDGVNVDIDGLIFPEAGTYFYEYIRTLTIPGYTGFTKEKIAPSHLYQPDWEQSDETAADFLKNKPFKDAFKPIVYEGETVFAYADGIAEVSMTTDKFLTAGKRYTYYYDGKNYTCEAVDVTAVFGIPVGHIVALGNLSLWGLAGGEELPFLIWYADAMAAGYMGATSPFISFGLIDKTADYTGYVVLAEGEGYSDTVTLEDVIASCCATVFVTSSAAPGLGAFANGFSLNVTLTGTSNNASAGSVERTLTQDDVTVKEKEYGVALEYDTGNGIAILVEVHNASHEVLGATLPKGIVLMNDDTSDGSAGWAYTTNSLTINNYPTKFEETEVKQIEEKYIPTMAAVLLYFDDQGYLYTNSDTSDTTKRMTAAELKSVLMGAKTVYISTPDTSIEAYLNPIGFSIRDGYGVVSAFEDGGVISFYTAEYVPATT